MEVKLYPDREAVGLTIDSRLDAKQFEELLADLAGVRARLEPPISRMPPGHEDPAGSDQRVSVLDDPTIITRLLRDGRIRLWIRHPGFGWLAFNLPVTTAAAIRDYLTANTPVTDPRANLFGVKHGGGDGAH